MELSYNKLSLFLQKNILLFTSLNQSNATEGITTTVRNVMFLPKNSAVAAFIGAAQVRHTSKLKAWMTAGMS